MSNNRVLLAACAVVTGIAAWELSDIPNKSTAVVAPPTPTAAASSGSVHVPTALPMAAAGAGAGGVPPPLPFEPKVSKAKLFDDFVEAGTPADKLMAYRLAQACVMSTGLLNSSEMIPFGERTPELQAKMASGELKRMKKRHAAT